MIEIPESLQWVAKYVVGAGDWPEGDETAMRRVEDAWVGLAADLRDLGPDANNAIDQVLAAIEGDTAQAISDRWTELGHGEGAFDGLIQHIETLGEEIGDGATEIEYTKLVIIATLVIFAVEMAVALAVAATGVGAPAAGAEAAAAQVTTRIAIRTALKQLLQRMLSKATLKAAARAAVRGAWENALAETAMDLGVKSAQVLAGTRDGITTEDLTEAGKNAVTAAATGAVTGGLEGLTSRGSPDGPSGNRQGSDPDRGDPDPPRRTRDQDPPDTGDRQPAQDPPDTGDRQRPDPGNDREPPGREGGRNRSDSEGERNTTEGTGDGSDAPEGENPYANAVWDGTAAAGTDLAETVTEDAVDAALDEDKEFSWEDTLSAENLASSAAAGVETGVGTLMDGGSSDSGSSRDPDNQQGRESSDPPNGQGDPPGREGEEGAPGQSREANPSTPDEERGTSDREGNQNNPNTSPSPGSPTDEPEGQNRLADEAKDQAKEVASETAGNVTDEVISSVLGEDEDDEEAEPSEEETTSEEAAPSSPAGETLMGGDPGGSGSPNQPNDPPPVPSSSQGPSGDPPQPPVSGADPAQEPPQNQSSAPASPPPVPDPAAGYQPEGQPAGNQGVPPAGTPPGAGLNVTDDGETSTSAASAATAAPPGAAPAPGIPPSAGAVPPSATPPLSAPSPLSATEAPRGGSGDAAAAAPGAAAPANASRNQARTGKPGSADRPGGGGARGQDAAPPGEPISSLPNTPGFDYNLFDPAHHARVLAEMSRPPIPTRPVRTTSEENIWSSDDRSAGFTSAASARADNSAGLPANADRPGAAPDRGVSTPGPRPTDVPAGPAHGAAPSTAASSRSRASGPAPMPPGSFEPDQPRRPYWNEPRPTDPIWNSAHTDAATPGGNDRSTPDHEAQPPHIENPPRVPSANTAPPQGAAENDPTRTFAATSNSSRTDAPGPVTPTQNPNDTSHATGRPNQPPPSISRPIGPNSPSPSHPTGVNTATRSPGRSPLTPDRPTAPPGRPPYTTTPLRPEFHGEHLPGNRQWGNTFVRYLHPQERAPYRLFASNGLLYTCEQQPLDTTYTSTLWTPQGGRAIFVMDEHGQLYASPYHILGEFHHSSFLAGAPVAAAGEIAAVQGRVQLISDHSTHYRPAPQFTAQVVDALARQGITFDQRAVEYHYSPGPPARH